MATLFSVFALILTLAPPAMAAPKFYVLHPSANYGNKCASLGFVGSFQFSPESDHPSIGNLVFTKSRQGFVVFHAHDGKWKMEIHGPWNEFIDIDFSNGMFSYRSSRPGHGGSCEGMFQ